MGKGRALTPPAGAGTAREFDVDLESDIRKAAQILRKGGLVAFPTETVYGLGADCESELAVRRIFAVKGRPSRHPLIVHLADPVQMWDYAAEVPSLAERLAARFWPGPLTIILKKNPKVALAVTGGSPTVGLRVPSHPVARALLKEFGRGVAAPSANRFGKVSPTTAAHVREDLGGDVDLVLDGGTCEVGIESTILDLSGPEPAILRPGGITPEQLAAAWGKPFPIRQGGGVAAPGQHPVHYAPRAGVILVSEKEIAAKVKEFAERGEKVAVLSARKIAPIPGALLLESTDDPGEFAHDLYSKFREADAQGIGTILVLPPPAEGIGLAVADRLRRASAARQEQEEQKEEGT